MAAKILSLVSGCKVESHSCVIFPSSHSSPLVRAGLRRLPKITGVVGCLADVTIQIICCFPYKHGRRQSTLRTNDRPIRTGMVARLAVVSRVYNLRLADTPTKRASYTGILPVSLHKYALFAIYSLYHISWTPLRFLKSYSHRFLPFQSASACRTTLVTIP